jgi:hypothetical protein
MTLCIIKSSSNQRPKHEPDYPSASLRGPNIGLFSAPLNPVATRIPVLSHRLAVPSCLLGSAYFWWPRRASPEPLRRCLRGRSVGSSWVGSFSRSGAKLPPLPHSWAGSFSSTQVHWPHHEGRGRREGEARRWLCRR